MKRITQLLLILACAATLAAQEGVRFEVVLDGAHAVPPNTSPNTGTGTFWVRPDRSMVGEVTAFDWFRFNPTSVQIFRAADGVHLGQSVVEIPYYNALVGDALDPGATFYQGPAFSLSESQYADLVAGNWYVNIFTSAYPDGEIRGRIVMVPEPGTWTLLAVGLGMVWILRRSRFQSGAT